MSMVRVQILRFSFYGKKRGGLAVVRESGGDISMSDPEGCYSMQNSYLCIQP